MEDTNIIHSDYLVERLLSAREENLFNYVKFRLVARALQDANLYQSDILDLGCADKITQRYLSKLGIKFRYFGVDYEYLLAPDLIADIRDVEGIVTHLPWQPEVILLLDILEHLDSLEDIIQVLKNCCYLLQPGGIIIVTVPQMYRLDRFKFAHLHYQEHKIRLRQSEWHELLSGYLEIVQVQGVGFISVLPYLVMFSPYYRDENSLGRIFRHLREKTLERQLFRMVDLRLSLLLGSHPLFRQWTNDILFICHQKRKNSE